ncbi:MAG: DNA polymerase Y family protein [Aestuariivita sp.]|nr:DNA polymerase Y family protein [Aestuariivita sp.]
MAKRILSIWFPRLASDIELRKRPIIGPFALVHKSGNSDHLHCLNSDAKAKGLFSGMALADARAICPDLVTRSSDLPSEALALVSIRRWASRYSPIIARDGADGLIADITGVPHLFGGEAGLRTDLQERLSRFGITAGSAIAETRGAAFALARHGGGIIAEGNLKRDIGKLPVSTLRISNDTVRALNRLGLSKIADLTPLPRAPLVRRFGQGLILRLDQALGQQSEPISAETDLPHFGVRIHFPEPIGLQTDVTGGLKRLLKRLCQTLAQYERGARRLRLYLCRVDHDTAIIEIGLARPMNAPERIAPLFSKGINELDAKFGIEAMRLVAHITEPLKPEQISYCDTRQTNELTDLFSSLGNRLGFDQVQRISPANSTIPERSFVHTPAAYSKIKKSEAHINTQRPAIIFPPEVIGIDYPAPPGTPPARFFWRQSKYRTIKAMGPERITPEWWFDDPSWRSGLRDYWRIETNEGLRIWLFHAPKIQQWSAQGTFI